MPYHPAIAAARALRRPLRELLRTIVDSCCPPACPGCGVALKSGDAALCAACRRRLQVRAGPVCSRCGQPRTPGMRCVVDHRAIRGIRISRAPFRYEGTGGALVRRLKFEGDRAALIYLARAMTQSIGSFVSTEGRRAVVVSVPLHPKKRSERGFDQAAALAEAVAGRAGLRFLPGVLRRVRVTLPQGDVRVVSRAANVRGAFAVRRPRRVDGQLVLLIDDVRTSGSTVLECARVLSAAGARGVAVLTAVQS